MKSVLWYPRDLADFILTGIREVDRPLKACSSLSRDLGGPILTIFKEHIGLLRYLHSSSHPSPLASTIIPGMPL